MTAPAIIAPDGAAELIATPALSAMLQTRLEQITLRGHTPQADDATGADRLIAIARAKLLKAVQQRLREPEQLLLAAADMTMGGMDRLDDADLAILYRRIIAAGALCLAAADTIDRERARRAAREAD